MRKTALLLASMSLAMLLASGTALAANQIDCSNKPGVLCLGTPRHDEIKGTDTHDEILARAGNDVVNARSGNDLVFGQRGADLLRAGHCDNDRMFGGSGDDTIDVSDECAFAAVVGGVVPRVWDRLRHGARG